MNADRETAEAELANKCEHSDSRLTCIDCGKPICSACLVQCPVGFRCKACVGPAQSTVASRVKGFPVAKAFALCGVIGFMGGWLCVLINIPFVDAIICYFVGLLIGRWVAKVIDMSRLSVRETRVVVFSLLFGLSLSPFNHLPAMVLMCFSPEAFATHGVFLSLTQLAGFLFSPACFIVGFLRPTIWGDRWY